MVVRLLNLSGLYLGEASDLINPAPDNPEGYWENARFENINTALLEGWGGAWDVPPVLPERWAEQANVIALREQALKLMAEFANCPYWGWKDPRTSLTLPFWLALLPDLRIIVCVRNPLEVAISLHRRGYSSNTFSFRLWQAYYERLIASTTPERRLITHHDSYFANAEAELGRVLNWLGWSVPGETIAQACTAVATSLRHHRMTITELQQARISSEGLALYERLCAEAGPIYEETSRDPQLEPSPTRTHSDGAPAKPETLYLEQIIEQQQQIEALERERRRLQLASEAQARAFEVQARSAHGLEVWAHELEEMTRAHQATIRAYQRALAPILPLVRAVRELRKRLTN